MINIVDFCAIFLILFATLAGPQSQQSFWQILADIAICLILSVPIAIVVEAFCKILLTVHPELKH